jgi:hypothetical protein
LAFGFQSIQQYCLERGFNKSETVGAGLAHHFAAQNGFDGKTYPYYPIPNLFNFQSLMKGNKGSAGKKDVKHHCFPHPQKLAS